MKILFPFATIGLAFLLLFVWTNLNPEIDEVVDVQQTRTTGNGEISKAETQPGVGPIAEHVGDNFYDFGTKEPGFEYSYVFPIKNVGDQTLVLSKGRKTCDCATIEIFDREIEPGEIGRVELKWEARYSKEDFHEGFSLRTNMRDGTEMSVSAKGVVNIIARAVPGLFETGSLSKGDQIKGSTIVFSQSWDNLIIHKVESSIKELKHEFVNVSDDELDEVEGKVGVRFNFVSPPLVDKGEFNNTIRLMVSDSDETPEADWMSLELVARGRVLGRYSITGDKFNHYNELDLRSLRADQEHETSIMMRVIADPKNLDAPIISSHPEGMKLDWVAVNPDHGIYKAVIKIPAGLEQGNYQTGENQAWVRLKFDHPEIDEITIPMVLRLFAPSVDVKY